MSKLRSRPLLVRTCPRSSKVAFDVCRCRIRNVSPRSGGRSGRLSSGLSTGPTPATRLPYVRSTTFGGSRSRCSSFHYVRYGISIEDRLIRRRRIPGGFAVIPVIGSQVANALHRIVTA